MQQVAPPRLPPELDPRGPRRPQRPAHRSRRGWRWLRWLATAVAALVFVVSVGGYLLYRYYNGRLTHVGIRPPGTAAPADTGGADENFLLVGSDTRAFAGGSAYQAATGSADYVTGQRSDTVILVHVPADGGKATIVSFPRDSYVQIPSYTDPHGGQHAAYMAKLNEAFSVGGPQLLVQLIENLSGLRVDHYVQVDFAGFKNMVAALGGVTLCVGTTRHDHDSGDQLTAGVHHNVSGDAALAFVRDRKGLPNGDLDRIKDQQYFLSQMFHEALSAGTLTNPFRLNSFLDALTSNVTVDNGFGFSAMRTLATQARHLDPAHVTFATIPITTDSGWRTIHGLRQSVVLIDQPAADAMFAALRGSASTAPPSSGSTEALTVPPSQVSVSVLNGTGRSGLAARTAADLAAQGFATPQVGNALPTATTTVRYGPGMEDAARTAAAAAGAQLVEDSSLSGSVVLVLGADFAGVKPVAVGGTVASAAPSAPATATPAPAAAPSCAP